MIDIGSPIDVGPKAFFERVRRLLQLRSQTQRIAFTATITPDAQKGESVIIDVLTNNVIVANPVNIREGMWLRFQFTQDGTGTRTVTFGNLYKVNWTPDTTGGKINTISFRFDGTNLVQMASAVGM